MLPAPLREPGPVVPVIRMYGAIGISSPLRPGLTYASLTGPIEKAFKTPGAVAVALAINSPGGSPVQSNLIFQRIRQMAEEKNLPVYAFAEDAAASGGYMLALAADEIYADPSSIVGSIGVVSASFGFTELIDKIGVERRVYTAGKSKVTLDPFLPEKAEDVKRLKALQADVHDTFIDMVKERRGDRLTEKDAKLFTGAFWTGKQAVPLGLIDGIGDIRSVMREKFGDKVKLKLITERKSLFRRAMPISRIGERANLNLTEGWADELLATLEARTIWARFGL